MYPGLTKPLIAAAAVGSVISGVALARAVTDEPSVTPSPSVGTVATAASTCPSAEEMEAYWAAHGKELKSAGACADPDPVPAGDGGETHAHGKAEPIDTWSEAQGRLDPEDDPMVVIGHDARGFYSVTMTLAPGQQAPPPSVRTEPQFVQWFASQEAAR